MCACELLYYPQKGELTLSPTNILVYEWVGGKHVCVYLIEVFKLLKLENVDFILRLTTLKVVSNKMVKH